MTTPSSQWAQTQYQIPWDDQRPGALATSTEFTCFWMWWSSRRCNPQWWPYHVQPLVTWHTREESCTHQRASPSQLPAGGFWGWTQSLPGVNTVHAAILFSWPQVKVCGCQGHELRCLSAGRRSSSNVGLMLVQRQRRLTSIRPALSLYICSPPCTRRSLLSKRHLRLG